MIQPQGFFAQHRYAPFQTHDRQLGVAGVGGGDVDGVDPWPVEGLGVAARGVFGPEVVGKGTGAFR
jgi:hypothetical protein